MAEIEILIAADTQLLVLELANSEPGLLLSCCKVMTGPSNYLARKRESIRNGGRKGPSTMAVVVVSRNGPEVALVAQRSPFTSRAVAAKVRHGDRGYFGRASPDGVLESGLLGCLPEKKVRK